MADPTPSVAAPNSAARPLRVLLAEDTVCIRRLVDRTLSRAGIEVFMATDGVEAVRAARDSGFFDVMIFDVEMPRFGGAEALRALRTLEIDTPAIAFTGSDSDDARRELLAAGFADVIPKGANYVKLVERCYALAAA